MTEDIILALRQLLMEIVVPDLKLLVAKADDLQHQLELSQRAIHAGLDALRLEMQAMRGEMTALRKEMHHFRLALRTLHGADGPDSPDSSDSPDTSQSEPESRENSARREEPNAQPVGPDNPDKRWVN